MTATVLSMMATLPAPVGIGLIAVSPVVLLMYWPVEAFVAGSAGNPFWLVYLLVGVIAHALALLVLGRRFARRTM